MRQTINIKKQKEKLPKHTIAITTYIDFPEKSQVVKQIELIGKFVKFYDKRHTQKSMLLLISLCDYKIF